MKLSLACVLATLMGLVLTHAKHVSPQAAQNACCRPATQQVPYYGSSAELATFAIVRSQLEDGKLTLYAEGPLPPEPGEEAGDWTSSDEGRSWTRTQPPLPGANAFPFGGWNAPSNPRRMYSTDATEHSDDGGRSWIGVDPVIDGRRATDFARSVFKRKNPWLRIALKGIDPHDADTIYAGIAVLAKSTKGITTPDEVPVPGIYVSHDAGRTWTKFTTGLSGDWFFGAIGISPVDARIFYNIDEGNVVKKSSDGGHHWNPVGQYEGIRAPMVFPIKKNPESEWEYIHPWGGLTKLQAYQWVFDPTDKDIVYLVCPKGVYRTLDGGRTWCLLNLGFDAAGGITSMAVNPLRPQEIFVAAADFGIFRSTDRGCHFENVTPPDAIRRPLPPPLPIPPPGAPPAETSPSEAESRYAAAADELRSTVLEMWHALRA